MGIFGRFMIPSAYDGNQLHGLYDTLLVSFSRYGEFKRLMAAKPPDERFRIVASIAVSHSEAFYCDEFGQVTKWTIEDGL